jgi:hypothetical protein
VVPAVQIGSAPEPTPPSSVDDSAVAPAEAPQDKPEPMTASTHGGLTPDRVRIILQRLEPYIGDFSHKFNRAMKVRKADRVAAFWEAKTSFDEVVAALREFIPT